MTPKRIDPKEKSELILSAATRVFSEKGYSAAKIDRIAELAGVGKGTVYEYFDSKEALFFAVFDQFMEKMLEGARRPLQNTSGSAIQRLNRMACSVLMEYEELEPLFPLIFEFWAASGSGVLRKRERIAGLFQNIYNELRAMCASILRSGIESGEFISTADPEALAAVIVGSFDGLFETAEEPQDA